MIYLTMLTDMLSSDLVDAIRQLKELNIQQLDLKGGIFGHTVENLDNQSREQLAALLSHTETEAYCFSSSLGQQNIAQISEQEFRQKMQTGLQNLLETVKYVRPKMIRLLACRAGARTEWPDTRLYLENQALWVYEAYREAIEQIQEAGILVTIENQPDSICSSPLETLHFFEQLAMGDKVRFTWDIQNMWQSGVYPSLEVYSQLKSLINYVHLKGGIVEPATPTVMAYRSFLAIATWPVQEIVSQVLLDEVSPIICLNPSHGQPPPNYQLNSDLTKAALIAEEARLDVAFLRKTFAAII